MTNYPHNLSEALISAVKLCDSDRVRDLLDGVEHLPFNCSSSEGSPLHVICDLLRGQPSEIEWESPIDPEQGKVIVYMLIDAGFDTELVDKSGNTCLFYGVKNESAYVCDILLQCGADMWSPTECKVPILEYVNQMSSSEIRSTFNKYFPGLWRSVESEDIYQVRKLVNLWCRTDLHKNGVTLKDIALGTGNEEIITLILGIFDSMKLVYHIYAKNIRAVSNLLEANRQRLRLDLRKMSDHGAPILYYLIKSEYIAAIELFIKHGCQLYSIMQDDLGYDMPVLFSALYTEVPVAVVEALLPPVKLHQEELLYKILYRGRSVLEVALEKSVNLDAFKVLIDRGGPLLLCDRNQENQTVRDLAVLSDETLYVNVIDQILRDWIMNPNEHPGRRERLALYGWDLETLKKELKGNLSTDEFFTHFQHLQFQMQEIFECIETGDLNTFLKLKENFENEFENFLWHGRVVGDGMPLLHKAVIYNRLTMVEIILGHKPPKESIDNLFDQNRRTALHYAYASASMKDIKKLLMSYGCSEHVLDKVIREPLDFRDKQDSADMIRLLDRLKTKELSLPEANPWSNNEAAQSRDSSSPSVCCQQSNAICKETHDPSDYESESFSETSEEGGTNAKSCIIF